MFEKSKYCYSTMENSPEPKLEFVFYWFELELGMSKKNTWQRNKIVKWILYFFFRFYMHNAISMRLDKFQPIGMCRAHFKIWPSKNKNELRSHFFFRRRRKKTADEALAHTIYFNGALCVYIFEWLFLSWTHVLCLVLLRSILIRMKKTTSESDVDTHM